MVAREHEPQPRVADYRRLLRKHRWLMTGHLPPDGAHRRDLDLRPGADLPGGGDDPDRARAAEGAEHPGRGPDGPGASDRTFYPTQYEIIKSRPVVERAVDALNAKKRAADDGAADPAGAVGVARRRAQAEHAAGPDQDRGPRSGAGGRGGQRRRQRLRQVQCRAQAQGGAGRAHLADRGGRAGSGRRSRNPPRRCRTTGSSPASSGCRSSGRSAAAKIMDSNKAFLEAQAQRLSLESKLQRARSGSPRSRPACQTIFTVADNPLIDKLKGEVGDPRDREVQAAEGVQGEASGDPEGRCADPAGRSNGSRRSSRTRCGPSRRSSRWPGRGRTARSTRSISSGSEGQQLNEKEIQYQNLQREVESNQQLYDSVVKRHQGDGGGRRAREQQRADHRGGHAAHRADPARERPGTWR